MKNRNTLLAISTLGFGLISGLRSALSPALLGVYLSRKQPQLLSGTPFEVAQSQQTAAVLALLGAGELVVDKIPILPDRIELLPLLGRAASGGLVGAVLFSTHNRKVGPGILLGALAAVAGAFLGFFFRTSLSNRIPDTAAAFSEDAIALAGGLGLLKMLDSNELR